MNFTYTSLFKKDYKLIITNGYQDILHDNLITATMQQDFEAIKTIVKLTDNSTGALDHALQWAAKKDNLEIFKYLQANGAALWPISARVIKWIHNNNNKTVKYWLSELQKEVL